jgi:hypothetical protein
MQERHCAVIAYEFSVHTVVVGAGAVGLAVPGGLGGEPAGVVGPGGGDAVVDCRTGGRDEQGDECDQRDGIGAVV